MGNILYCSSNSDDKSQETSKDSIKPLESLDSSAQTVSKPTNPDPKKTLNPESSNREAETDSRPCQPSLKSRDFKDPERPLVVEAQSSNPAQCSAIDTKHKARVLVHPICVGQGDAILLEVHHEGGKRETHLIDGGRGQKTRNTQFYEHLKETLRAKGCIEKAAGMGTAGTLEDRRCDRVVTDTIIITHPNQDHYGGINRLLYDFTIACPITTTIATCVYTEHTNPGVTGHRIGEGFRTRATDLVQHRFPVPQDDEQGRRHTYIKTLPKRSTAQIVKNPGFTGDLNQSSIITMVNLPGTKYDYDVVLTGDSYGYIIQRALDLEGRSVGVFQVPHHGSRGNYSTTPSTIAQCTRFYSSFRADVYLICHGAHKGFNHPHKEVITGILTAAVDKRHHCKIVVTATWFDEFKIVLTEYKDIRNWRDYVEIYHFKEGTPYVTLDPSVEQMHEGLQLYEEQVHLEEKLLDLKLQRKAVDCDGNSFFNAISAALQIVHSVSLTHIELREKVVDYLLMKKDIYFPRSGLRTMEEYCQKAGEYLLDGYTSSNVENIIPEAMAEALMIRIQIISTNSSHKDQLFGPEHSQTIIQLVYDSSENGHYDYAVSVNTTEHTPEEDASTPPPERERESREYTPTREELGSRYHHSYSQTSRRLLYTDQSVNEERTISCCICKQQLMPTDRLFQCISKKCTVKTHYKCEFESRSKKNFKRNFGKCEYCRTCKECGRVMGGTKNMCRSCDSYVHAECMRQVGSQRQENYECKDCRQKQNS